MDTNIQMAVSICALFVGVIAGVIVSITGKALEGEGELAIAMQMGSSTADVRRACRAVQMNCDFCVFFTVSLVSALEFASTAGATTSMWVTAAASAACVCWVWIKGGAPVLVLCAAGLPLYLMRPSMCQSLMLFLWFCALISRASVAQLRLGVDTQRPIAAALNASQWNIISRTDAMRRPASARGVPARRAGKPHHGRTRG